MCIKKLLRCGDIHATSSEMERRYPGGMRFQVGGTARAKAQGHNAYGTS